MSDYLQYFDFDAYMADGQVEPFDFGFLSGQPSTTHGGYDPNPSPPDLSGANAGTIDSHQHSPFACTCGVKFARVDVLNRHIRNFSKDAPKFPCTYCKRHRGKAGFRRRDHLVQHLERYHKLDPDEIEKACPKEKRQTEHDFLVCPHQGCDAYRDDAFYSLPRHQRFQSKPFKSRGEYSKHMKEVHKETPFPCTVAECDRVGAKGYMREKDLIKHLSNKHPEAPQYEAKTRIIRFDCPAAGCGRSYATGSDLRLHERSAHWSFEERRARRDMLRMKSS
ncbi:hypothetical protein DL771_002985 [Monosporascus sp. 5C6A]|nr:hypothetical protein DL771_002985 [Monosporascus sp. 5C6A]